MSPRVGITGEYPVGDAYQPFGLLCRKNRATSFPSPEPENMVYHAFQNEKDKFYIINFEILKFFLEMRLHLNELNSFTS